MPVPGDSNKIADAIKREFGLDIKTARKVVAAVFDELMNVWEKQGTVNIPNIGQFWLLRYASTNRFNMQAMEWQMMPACSSMRVRFVDKLKRRFRFVETNVVEAKKCEKTKEKERLAKEREEQEENE